MIFSLCLKIKRVVNLSRLLCWDQLRNSVSGYITIIGIHRCELLCLICSNYAFSDFRASDQAQDCYCVSEESFTKKCVYKNWNLRNTKLTSQNANQIYDHLSKSDNCRQLLFNFFCVLEKEYYCQKRLAAYLFATPNNLSDLDKTL